MNKLSREHKHEILFVRGWKLSWVSDNCTMGIVSNLDVHWVKTMLVAWHSGKNISLGRRTFPVARSTFSWWVTTYVGKLSAGGQPTRSTQPFILSVSINE